MFRYIFIILFLTSSCSIYDLSATDRVNDFFNNKEKIILYSPSIVNTLYTDSIQLEALVQDPFGIQKITITPSSGTAIVINPIGNPLNFGISQNLLIKSAGLTDDKYTIKIEFENSTGETIEKEFIFTIKLISVDYTFSLVGSIAGGVKPNPGGAPWTTSDGISINTTTTGAPIKRIEVAGTLGSYVLDPVPTTSSTTILISTISKGAVVPFDTVSMNIRIISDTGGTSMETVVLVDP